MATIKQNQAVEKMVGNGGNITQAMRMAGYSENTLNTPQKLTESKGFKELMASYGLTEGLLTKALVEDIKKKPQRRIQELKLGADILGLNKQETKVAVQMNIAQILDRHEQRVLDKR